MATIKLKRGQSSLTLQAGEPAFTLDRKNMVRQLPGIQEIRIPNWRTIDGIATGIYRNPDPAFLF